MTRANWHQSWNQPWQLNWTDVILLSCQCSLSLFVSSSLWPVTVCMCYSILGSPSWLLDLCVPFIPRAKLVSLTSSLCLCLCGPNPCICRIVLVPHRLLNFVTCVTWFLLDLGLSYCIKCYLLSVLKPRCHSALISVSPCCESRLILQLNS